MRFALLSLLVPAVLPIGGLALLTPKAPAPAPSPAPPAAPSPAAQTTTIEFMWPAC